MKFSKAFLVLWLFLTYAGSSFANTFDENELDINSFLRSSRVLDNKVYLKPGSVYVAPYQIFLNVEGTLLPIKNLSADGEGVFITVEEIVTAAKNKTWRCRWCQRVNSMEDRWCAGCGRQWGE